MSSSEFLLIESDQRTHRERRLGYTERDQRFESLEERPGEDTERRWPPARGQASEETC